MFSLFYLYYPCSSQEILSDPGKDLFIKPFGLSVSNLLRIDSWPYQFAKKVFKVGQFFFFFNTCYELLDIFFYRDSYTVIFLR